MKTAFFIILLIFAAGFRVESEEETCPILNKWNRPLAMSGALYCNGQICYIHQKVRPTVEQGVVLKFAYSPNNLRQAAIIFNDVMNDNACKTRQEYQYFDHLGFTKEEADRWKAASNK